jgi:RND family efflux transporter MFP subunit
MKVNSHVGEAVDLTTVLAEIADLDNLVISVQIPSAESTSLKMGMAAEVSAKPVGKVTYISPSVDAANDTVIVRVAVSKDAGLRPGQFLGVRIVSEERKDRLAVPRLSLYTTPEGESTLFLVAGDKATQKTVKTGLRDGPLVEVEGEGLALGQSVVTEGSYALPKETKVRVLAEATK